MIKKAYTIIFFALVGYSIVPTQCSTTHASHQQPAEALYREEEQKLFFPPSIPTTSSYEHAIDAIYGPTGLNLATQDINKIKKTYFYLEFLAKADKALSDKQYAAYKKDFQDFFIDIAHQKPQEPTQEILQTDGWKNITITAKELQNSQAWQLFIKSLVSDCYVHDYVTLEIIHQVEDQIFPYIPNIEVAYYNYDFTRLRNLAETTRIKAVLQSDLKQRYLADCTDWKSIDHTKLGADVVAFKKTPFYQSSHNLNTWVTLKKDGKKLAGTPTHKALKTPVRQHVWCYFMLLNIQNNITSMMTTDNLQEILQAASNTILQPNFFFYEPQDLVYLYDFLSLKEVFTQDHAPQEATTEQHQRKAVVKPETLRKVEHMVNNQRPNTPNTVKVQSLGGIQPMQQHRIAHHVAASNRADKVVVQGLFSDIGHAFESAGKAIVHGAEAAGEAVVHGAEAAAEGVAGFGASMIGDITGDSAIRKWGHKVSKEAIANLKETGKDLDSAVSDFAKAIEDGIIAPIAEVSGSLVGFILQDKKIGQDMTGVIENVSDSLVNIAATLVKSTVNIVDNEAVQAYTLSEKFAEVVVDASMATVGVLTDNKALTHQATEDLSEDGKALVKDTITAITQTFTTLLDAVKSVMMSVVQCLGAITNSITTIFIDTVREVTYIGASIAQDLGAHVNAKEVRDHVTAVLEAHRRTINMVTGIVLAVAMTVAVTVATGGAGAPEAAAMDAALIGGEAAGEGTAIAVGEAGVEAGAEAGVEAGTESGVEAAGETGTETAGQTGTESSSTTSSSEGTSSSSQTTTQSGESSSGESTDGSESDSSSKDEGEKGDENSDKENENKDEDKDKDEEKDKDEDKGKKKSKWTKANTIGQLLNVAFGAFNVISGYNQDEAAIEKQEKAEESLRNLWKFIEDTKTTLTQSEQLYLNELSKKHHAAVGNQALGLEYYIDFLNSSTDNLEEQIALALGQEYISMLTPNAQGLRAADIGATWGIMTPFVYLYPSQGFLSTTLGRKEFPFAQEIAQAPLAAKKQSADKQSLSETSQEPLKLWFNQRAVSTVKQAATDKLEVEVRFRVIYNLTTAFHLGLYLGGKYHDYFSPSYLQELQNKGSVDLDTPHLAKMFVLHRDNEKGATKIGVYEHEGKDWIVDTPLSDTIFKEATVYRMHATLDGDSLTASFWSEDDPSQKWSQTITVSQTDQRTFGMIFSGVAVEWDVITPHMSIQVNPKARPAIGNQSEADREKASQAQWQALMQPTFGKFKLQALGKPYILRGQYLYATTNTQLTTEHGKPMADYLLLASAVTDDVKQIGMPPATSGSSNPAPTVAISVITGNVYNQAGAILSHKHNVWSTYEKTHGPFNPQLATEVKNAQQEIIQQLMHTHIGTYKLTAISKQMVENSQFIYTCDQTITQKDSTDKPITDYLIMADIIGDSIGTAVGMPPSKNPKGMVSLITGNVYDATSTDPIDSGYSELIPYENQYGKLPAQVMKKINAAKAAYMAALEAAEKKTEQPKKPAQPKQSQTISLGSSGLSLGSMSSSGAPNTGGLQLGLSSSAPGLSLSTNQSLSTRQNNAANGSGLQLGGLSGGGLSLGGSSSNSLSLGGNSAGGLSLGGQPNQGLSLNNNSSGLSLG